MTSSTQAACAGYDHRTGEITVDLYGSADMGPARVVALTDDDARHLIHSIEHALKCKAIANHKGESAT